MMVPKVGELNLQITVAEEHGWREAYTQLITPYYSVGSLSMSSYYLTLDGTRTLYAAGFYPATKWTAQFHAKRRIAKINK